MSTHDDTSPAESPDATEGIEALLDASSLGQARARDVADLTPTLVAQSLTQLSSHTGDIQDLGQSKQRMVAGEGLLDDGIPFLARVESEDRSALLALGRQLNFEARAVLIRQNEPSSHVLFLVHGWTKVTASAANGYEALLALRGPGDIVGESAALTGRPRAATVTALEPVRALAVERETFREFLSRSPAVSLALLGLTANRTRAANRRRLEFASMSVRERLALLLVDLTRAHGRRTDEGIELSVPLSQQELAGAVGASREMVQRLLRELRGQGAVSTGRRTLMIRRPDMLRRIIPVGPASGTSYESHVV